MTVIGSGGLRICTVDYTKKFKKDLKRLDPTIQEKAFKKIEMLYKQPFPPGLCFEKLKGYHNPDIYTIHVTGNFKISLEINGTHAQLRRIGVHNTIDSTP